MTDFSKQLILWYQKQLRDLPWRVNQDPYRIWVSEVMLQQTTVVAVIPYFEKWMQCYPTLEDVAEASLEEVMKTWEGLGYYRRVKNLHKAAQIIQKEHGGKVPRTRESLHALPGFGPYTIGAVLSIAFNQREPIIDANVRRLVMRLLAIEGIADTKQDPQVYDYLEEVMPQKNMRDFNQALMEMGALVCRSQEPICLLCPIKNYCEGYAKGIQEIIPIPKKKKIHKFNAAIAVIRQSEKFLIQKRTKKGLLEGLWEFPGGKQEAGESIEDTLKREVREELETHLEESVFLLNVKHNYTQFSVTLYVYDCKVRETIVEHETRLWVSLEEMQKYPMPSGSARIVDYLLKEQEVIL
jgi:A/G-specific adenine glycosylase